MTIRTPLIFGLIMVAVPSAVEASVIINEVAWMGSAASANHEWIELHNTGSSEVVVDDWTLKDGMNLNINLTGVISPGAYAVLERTSDDSAPGLAFIIYTGALVNTGATLTLRDAAGQIVDQVAGGENWQDIGGDNVTKETAQYTTAGWVTDVPTPGSANRSGRPVDSNPNPVTTSSNPGGTSSGRVISGSKPRTVNLTTPDTVLKLTTDIQSVAYVNQTIPLRVSPSGISKAITDSLNYTWNFGDGETATGKEVSYRYAYPGTYVVTIRANYARHDQVARQEITILPVTFSLARTARGEVQLHNDAPYDVDLSGYTLRGLEAVVFPQHSIIAPKATLTFPASRLGRSDLMLGLYDAAGSLVTSLLPGGFMTTKAAEAAVVARPLSPVYSQVYQEAAPARPDPAAAAFVFNTEAGANSPLESEVVPATTVPITANLKEGDLLPPSAAAIPASPTRWPYVLFFILLVSTLAVLIYGRPRKVAQVSLFDS